MSFYWLKTMCGPRTTKQNPKPIVQRSSFSPWFYTLSLQYYTCKPRCTVYHSPKSILYFLLSIFLLKLRPPWRSYPQGPQSLHPQTFPVKINLASFSISFTPILQLSLYYNSVHVQKAHKPADSINWVLCTLGPAHRTTNLIEPQLLSKCRIS